jgi:hypothetical protein
MTIRIVWLRALCFYWFYPFQAPIFLHLSTEDFNKRNGFGVLLLRIPPVGRVHFSTTFGGTVVVSYSLATGNIAVITCYVRTGSMIWGWLSQPYRVVEPDNLVGMFSLDPCSVLCGIQRNIVFWKIASHTGFFIVCISFGRFWLICWLAPGAKSWFLCSVCTQQE